jgi:hypothetical protein
VAEELLLQLENGSLTLRKEVIDTLLTIIEINDYQNVENFEWLFTKFKQMILHCPSACEKNLARVIQVES